MLGSRLIACGILMALGGCTASDAEDMQDVSEEESHVEVDGCELSAQGKAVFDTLEASHDFERGDIWDLSCDNALPSGFVLETPPASTWKTSELRTAFARSRCVRRA